jgi:hypothetical protein
MDNTVDLLNNVTKFNEISEFYNKRLEGRPKEFIDKMIIDSIGNNLVYEINKYIAPYFFFDKNNYIKGNKQVIKKLQFKNKIN